MRVYITKYALTVGIQIKEAEICHGVSDKMIQIVGWQTELYHKPYWHTSPTEAEAHAESMRVAKIASMKRSIAKLEKLQLRVPS